MSRNIDKSNSVLVKYQEQQAADNGGYKDYSRYKRPKRVASVSNVKEAIQWRNQLINEFKVLNTRVFDPSLSESDLREVNDQLNTLIQEKKRWDWHINNKLRSSSSKSGIVSNDRFVIGGKVVLGKRYFGRAIELPEIKDYIAEQKRKQLLSQPKQLVNIKKIPSINDKSNNKMKQIYYGQSFSDDDILKRDNFEKQWTPILQRTNDSKINNTPSTHQFTSVIPTQLDMEKWLVERRKQDLLKKLDL
ncbi:similar to Saccharomyces cerevisiae YJR050W ISY1 Member of NineTeen Complex (NTC) that contains Prp19p and stabilizes U6 snRNA in catalytic forms of spliceosome containing U2 [Maudiozyma barnettii]|uniref:Pre-mRNA-splicing factor ISY1 n=1 Tax=Maudiozyma barnettii TaxID=61262 RepID=A0A8H2ZI69_9SACH|nr:Isy1p [Kazachstania barnettii]CAB4254658.1 similar to Saccharomyces cerevisiae YJR050W ISY1 Member of NineTeen Complex (NTC) that contains Prp19p and stabilizes U6 snRNA in catalytic forms of spliceosome containing U2 [Kazachstania barnettii]CAD1782700.1 similar to Saccharomyces cerevisiae YJR050W ISY1 Member of NineTeen Complex (NTC) that contains Prp19p and stabilizes U6 snRNA in catalytic forms of spliceosome containing U2 [Kazachstania barnettii]